MKQHDLFIFIPCVETPLRVPRSAQKPPPTTTPPASRAPPALGKTPPTKSSTKAASSQLHGKEPEARPPPSMPSKLIVVNLMLARSGDLEEVVPRNYLKAVYLTLEWNKKAGLSHKPSCWF